jgi:ribosome maturation factor RimP
VGFGPLFSFRILVSKEGEDMSKKEIYESKTEAYVLPILAEHNFELVDVEYVKEGGEWYLRIYIDKEGGISIDDCELVSRQMNEILDREDYISEQYIFEVSSPGLQRPLKKERDYVRNMNKLIEIRTYQAVDRQKEFTGLLRSYDEDSVTIETEDGETRTFRRPEIALIRQAIDF